ncbi:Polycystin cation channel-domain-containing protein [Tribonema minus]|uniref:Polycystin cation channel-domain-containing protein n=1 Tax=Tribonema minus TaxID=303371 RepID=A0A835Z1J4_9STRA|nr:Polycystin cation channel-domain-containing protein [Tribonema minus]
MDTTYFDIGGPGDVFNWLNGVFLPQLLSPLPNATDGQVSDRVGGDGGSLRVGVPRLRLVRVRSGTCRALPTVVQLPEDADCYGPITSASEAHEPFLGIPWRSASELNNGGSVRSHRTGFRYPGSGYVVDLPTNATAATAIVDGLFRGRFLDTSARLLAVEFSAFSASVNTFVVATALVEFMPSGAAVATVNLKAAALMRARMALAGGDRAASTLDAVMVALEMALYGIVVALAGRDVVRAGRVGIASFFAAAPFRVVDVLNYAFFIGVIVLRCQSVLKMDAVLDKVALRNEFVPLLPAARAALAVDGLNAFNAVLCTVRLLDMLRFVLTSNRKLAQFTATLVAAAVKLSSLMVIIGVVLCAYAVGFNLGFGANRAEYVTFGHIEAWDACVQEVVQLVAVDAQESLLTLFKSLLGDMEVDSFRDVNRVLGPILFTTYVIIMVFTILSMFLTIVNVSYEEVQARLVHSHGADPIAQDLARLSALAADAYAKSALRRWLPKCRRRGSARHELLADVTPAVTPRVGDAPPSRAAAAALRAASSQGSLRGGERARDPWVEGLAQVSTRTVWQRLLRMRQKHALMEVAMDDIVKEMAAGQ